MSTTIENKLGMFKFISEKSSDAHFLIGRDAKFLYVNETACRMMGYSEKEMLTLRVPDVDNLYDLNNFQDLFDLIQEETLPPIETVNRRKDGTTFNSEITVTGYQIDGSSYMFSALRDITGRKLAENAVLNIAKGVSAAVGEEFFYSLADHLAKTLEADYAYIAEIIQDKPTIIKTLSLIADGKPVDNIEVNLADTPCETIIDYNIHTYPSGVQKKFSKALMMAQMNVEGYAGKLLSSSSGKKLGLMAIMYRKPIKNISLVESVLKIFAERASAEIERRHAEESIRKAKEEIETWNKELEKRVREKTEALLLYQTQLIQSEKMSAMGQMASGLAHELNSPLAGLLPMIEKFKDSEVKDSEKHFELTLMFKACMHMARIVKDFGVFSRKSKRELTRLQLSDVIEDTLSFSGVKLRQKGIQIIKDYDIELPDVLGEKTELQQVVLNMISNACDAMPEGGKFIIKTGSLEKGAKIFMEFIDNGSGINNENLKKIFDPFFTTKMPGEGTGLGLSVSYGIIEKHEGKISVINGPENGARFLIVLPALKGTC